MVIASLNRRVRALPRRTRFLVSLGSLGAASLFAESGCSSDSDQTTEELDPPLLEIRGAQNADGKEFDRDDEFVEVACDPRLTIRLGPSTDGAGLLDNWDLRGPRNCSEGDQCGFVRVELLDEDEKVLATVEQASLNPLIDGAKYELEEVRQLVVSLYSGYDGALFLVDGEPVMDSWKIRFESATMCGMGGAGGGSGTGGMDGLGGETSTGGSNTGGGAMGGEGGAP